MTWEEAVKHLRSKPENHQSILDNYFDEDIFASVERFYHSDEFKALVKLIPPNAKTLLDIGAGRGIASYAFAKKGLQVTALEPDTSNDVGSGAIKKIATACNLSIRVEESFGEQLPFESDCFDVVYARQVLHHAHNLTQFCKEAARVLKHGGLFIATREHVLSKESDLNAFLAQHPLHNQYGGEHAFTLKEYLGAIQSAGLQIKNVLHPYASVINYAPLTETQLKNRFAESVSGVTGNFLAKALVGNKNLFSILTHLKASRFKQPGRLYSFIATK